MANYKLQKDCTITNRIILFAIIIILDGYEFSYLLFNVSKYNKLFINYTNIKKTCYLPSNKEIYLYINKKSK